MFFTQFSKPLPPTKLFHSNFHQPVRIGQNRCEKWKFLIHGDNRWRAAIRRWCIFMVNLLRCSVLYPGSGLFFAFWNLFFSRNDEKHVWHGWLYERSGSNFQPGWEGKEKRGARLWKFQVAIKMDDCLETDSDFDSSHSQLSRSSSHRFMAEWDYKNYRSFWSVSRIIRPEPTDDAWWKEDWCN